MLNCHAGHIMIEYSLDGIHCLNNDKYDVSDAVWVSLSLCLSSMSWRYS